MDQKQEMQATIDLVTQTIGDFNAEMVEVDRVAAQIGRRTTRLIRMVLSVLAVSGAIILYLVVHLTGNMSTMIESMNTMYSHFGLMSKNMHEITGSVTNMGHNIVGIPSIAKAMQQMNGDVSGMSGSVTRMTLHIQSMERNIGLIDGGVQEMSGRFISVTGSVNRLNYNVNQMARPTDMLGPFGW
ncbi:MAG: hypothetical protein H7837_01280 [Magnetococcus sp. MYC-9]